MYDIDHPEFIEERKQNLDAYAYEKNLNQDVKIPIIKKKMIVMIKLNTEKKA